MTRWKYDVNPADPLVEHRIPVTSMWPVLPYLAVLHKESPHRPTDRETQQLARFIEMVKLTFSQVERAGMDGEKFDFHPRARTVVFHKYRTRDWGYRRASWGSRGFAPPSPHVATRAVGPLSLVGVMDLIYSDALGNVDESWIMWKEAHPATFGR